MEGKKEVSNNNANVLCQYLFQAKTRDRNIFVFSPNFLNRIVKVLFAFFIPLWLIFPTILLYNVTSHGGRAIIYAIFTFWTSFIVISMANVTKYDLTLALIT